MLAWSWSSSCIPQLGEPGILKSSVRRKLLAPARGWTPGCRDLLALCSRTVCGAQKIVCAPKSHHAASWRLADSRHRACLRRRRILRRHQITKTSDVESTRPVIMNDHEVSILTQLVTGNILGRLGNCLDLPLAPLPYKFTGQPGQI